MRKMTWRLLGIAAMAICPVVAWAKCGVNSFEIPVTMSGLRAIAMVRINGVETPLTVDSGAFFSMIPEAAAAQLNLKVVPAPSRLAADGLTGSIALRMTRVERLGLQGVEIPNVEFLVGGNEPGEGTMGLLGRNLLGWADTEYDLAHGVIRMMRPNGDCDNASMAYWAGSTPVGEVPLRTSLGEQLPPIRAKAKINGKSITVVFDTGAESILSLSAAKSAGIATDEANMRPAGPVHGAGHGELPSWTVQVDSFELGGERITNSRLRVADFDMEDVDMLIGIDYFLSHRIYVARSQRRMYFTYSGGPVFDLSIKISEASIPGQDDGIPNDAAGFAHRGAVLFARGEYPSALADLDRACDMAPTVAKYFIQRGRIYAFMQQFLKAMSDYDQAVRLDPSDHTARLERARIRVALHEINSALEDLQILTQALPMQSNMRRDIGDIYVAAALPRLAIPQFNLWIAGHGDDVDKPEVLNARCWARALVGSELDKAVEDCNAAVRAKPKDAAFLDSRGLVYLRQGKLSDAMKDYDAALKLNPKIAWSLYGRGLIQQRMGKNELATADIASAKQVRPSIEEEVTRYGVVVP